MSRRVLIIALLGLSLLSLIYSQEIFYSVEYGPRPSTPPDLTPVFMESYRGFNNVYVVVDNWYYASRERADSIGADAFLIPGGSTSDVPFYDGSLDSYVNLLRNPGRPALGFCAGIQFLLMSRGGICAHRSGEHGNESADIFEYDAIFDGCPNPYIDQGSHSYSIVDVPESYKILASTRACYVTFAKHRSMPLYGSQLHIERMNSSSSAGPAVLSNFRNVIVPRKFHGISEAIGFPGEPGKALLTWWKAKTEEGVSYQIFHSSESSEIDFSLPLVETSDLEYLVTDLEPDLIHHFAVRAVANDIDDSNSVICSVVPDGHQNIVFQNGLEIDNAVYDECEATVIFHTYPNSNYGSRGAPGKGTLYWWDSGLVKFNGLHSYLAGKTVIGGKLTFIFAGGVESNTNSTHIAEIGVYRILKDWNEGIGYLHSEARTEEVTWNSAKHNNLSWEIPGCRGNSDREQEPLGMYTIKGDGTGIEFDGTVEISADLIQRWVDQPDSNFGLLFEKTDTYPDNEYFHFEDNDNEWFMNHPRLTVHYLDETGALADDDQNISVPGAVQLNQNYPNPFNPSTRISYSVKNQRFVTLRVYDSLGREIQTLVNGYQQPGEYHVEFVHEGLSNGVYFYSIRAGDYVKTGKMLLLK